MSAPTSRLARRSRRRTLALGSLVCLLLAALTATLATYFLFIKPSLLFKQESSAVSRFERSFYGSADEPLVAPIGAAHTSDGRMFVIERSGNGIVVFDRYGQREKTLADAQVNNPVALVATPDNTLIVASVTSTGKGRLQWMTREGKVTRTITLADARITGLSLGVDEQGRDALYVAVPDGVLRADLEGTFHRQYRSAGRDVGSFSLVSGIAAARTREGQPLIVLGDTATGRVTALTSLDASPVVAWSSTGWTAPAGMVAQTSGAKAGSINVVYVADALQPGVAVLDAYTGNPRATYATAGSDDGALATPTSVMLADGSLYVADPANARVSAYTAQGAKPMHGIKLTSATKAGFLLPPLLFLLAALVLFVMRTRIRQERYVLSLGVFEQEDDGALALKTCHLVESIECITRAQEYARSWATGTRLVIDAHNPSARALARLAARDECKGLDAFDQETLALVEPRRHNTALITPPGALADAARACEITVYTPQQLSQAADAAIAQESPEQPAPEQKPEPELELEPMQELTAQPEQPEADDAGFARRAWLLLVVVITCALLIAPVFAGAASQRTITTTSIPGPTHSAGDTQASASLATSSTSDAHTRYTSNCALCHGATSSGLSALTLDPSSQACAYCHTSAVLMGSQTVYRAAHGAVTARAQNGSGHVLGGLTTTPVSSSKAVTTLGCSSCHTNFTHVTAVASCESCHDKAVASKRDAKAHITGDSFELTGRESIHTGTSTALSAGRNAHAQANMTCGSCHRGDLGSQRSATCSLCHYTATTLASDLATATTDWPHGSREDVSLLGNWTTVPSGEDAGSKTKPALGSVVGANAVEVGCGRCHPTEDGVTYVKSVHTVVHDAVRNGSTEYILSRPASVSALVRPSVGYLGSGITQQEAPFAGDTGFGPDDGSFENVSCETCHYSDVQTEHALRSRGGCGVCHTDKTATGSTDWLAVRARMSTKDFTTCGTESAACHSKTWHGADMTRFTKAHAVSTNRKADGTATRTTSCGGSPKGNSCHGPQSASSLFRFGEKDLASAHNDYWNAQKVSHSTNTRYTKTIVNIKATRGCGICHRRESAVIGGAALKERKGSIDCADCHNDTTRIYAQSECYRAQPIAFKGIKQAAATPDAQLDEKATAYLNALAKQMSGTGEGVSAESTSVLGAGTVKQSVDSIPRGFLPLSRPLGFESKLLILRAYFTPYPSIMNHVETGYISL